MCGFLPASCRFGAYGTGSADELTTDKLGLRDTVTRYLKDDCGHSNCEQLASTEASTSPVLQRKRHERRTVSNIRCLYSRHVSDL